MCIDYNTMPYKHCTYFTSMRSKIIKSIHMSLPSADQILLI